MPQTKYRLPSFCCTLLYGASQITFFFFFYILKAGGNAASGKLIDVIFPTAFAHFLSLGHTWVVLAIFQTLMITVFVMYSLQYSICDGDLWSVIFDVTAAARL